MRDDPRCPRCRGNIIRGEDGPSCLQCGWIEQQVPEWIIDEAQAVLRGERRRGRYDGGARL